MPSTKSLTMLWLIIILTIYSLSSLALAQNDTSNTSDNILALISGNNCPPPLIVRDPNGLIDPSQNCLNNCCLACPFPNNFYEKKKIEITYKVFAVIGIISFFLMILLCVFFMIFPSQKQNHLAKLLLFPLALSVMIFEGSEFFTLNQRQSQCLDPITAAIPKKNRYCTAQAFFTLSGAYATASYSALLMVHLHLISVWRSEFVTKRIKIFHALIFGSSLAAFLFPYFSNNIQSSSNICFISLDAAPSYFFFLSFIYIAFAAHLTTFIHMVHVTLKSNRHYSVMSSLSKLEAERQLIYLITIFKMQWRALLGALLMLLIYVLNWYFYVFKLRSSNSAILTNSWVIDWLTCLYNKRDQNSCVAIADVPSYGYIVTLLFFNRTAGILIFIIFAAKKSILLEAYDFIRGKSRSTSVSFFETESGFRSTRGSIRRYSTAENGIITSSEGIKAGNSIGRNRPDIRSDPISIKFSQKEKTLT